MPLFKKKKKEEPEGRFELPELPPFSEMQQIKEAIKPVEMQPLQPIQQAFQPIAPVTRKEIPEFRVLTQEISEPVEAEREIGRYQEREERYEAPKMKEPIFVKIDKFKDALASFELIKEKLAEIDNLLKKIRETRAQEQAEFDSWEKEIEEIKARVEGIDAKLFSKVE
jgi:hypothetical protein